MKRKKLVTLYFSEKELKSIIVEHLYEKGDSELADHLENNGCSIEQDGPGIMIMMDGELPDNSGDEEEEESIMCCGCDEKEEDCTCVSLCHTHEGETCIMCGEEIDEDGECGCDKKVDTDSQCGCGWCSECDNRYIEEEDEEDEDEEEEEEEEEEEDTYECPLCEKILDIDEECDCQKKKAKKSKKPSKKKGK